MAERKGVSMNASRMRRWLVLVAWLGLQAACSSAPTVTPSAGAPTAAMTVVTATVATSSATPVATASAAAPTGAPPPAATLPPTATATVVPPGDRIDSENPQVTMDGNLYKATGQPLIEHSKIQTDVKGQAKLIFQNRGENLGFCDLNSLQQVATFVIARPDAATLFNQVDGVSYCRFERVSSKPVIQGSAQIFIDFPQDPLIRISVIQGKLVRVAVADGTVSVRAGGEKTAVAAGQEVSVEVSSNKPSLGPAVFSPAEQLLFRSMASAASPSRSASAANRLVWLMDLSAVMSLDPADAYLPDTRLPIHALYETLVRYDGEDTTAKPGLASAWTTANIKDGLQITFTLRVNARFASGNVVGADDVVYSFERSRELDKLNKTQSMQWNDPRGLQNASIEANGAQTVVLSVPHADSPARVLSLLASAPLSIVDAKVVKAFEVNGDRGNHWLRLNSAGSGQFALDPWTPLTDARMHANPYAAVKALMPNLVFRHAPDSAVQLEQLQNGDADIATLLSLDELKLAKNNPQLTTTTGSSLRLVYVGMNTAMKPLDRPQVRDALRRAIDAASIGGGVLAGNARVMQGIVPIGVGDVNLSALIPFDVSAAKQSLAAAGLAGGFSLTLLAPSDSRGFLPPELIAAPLVASWAAIGVNVSVQSMPRARLLQMYLTNKAALVLTDFEPDFADPDAYAAPLVDPAAPLSIAARNGWKDGDAIGIAKTAAVLADTAKRAAAYKGLDEYAAKNGPYAALLQPNLLFARRVTVTGFAWNPAGYTDIWLISK
jgi:peptide/nickel transport system substrate-binding protein